MSFADMGPSFGSYRPPLFGKFTLSSNTGLSTFCTEMDRTSSVDKKEKESEVISELMEWAISIAAMRPKWRCGYSWWSLGVTGCEVL